MGRERRGLVGKEKRREEKRREEERREEKRRSEEARVSLVAHVRVRVLVPSSDATT